jgi:hypothetical protein
MQFLRRAGRPGGRRILGNIKPFSLEWSVSATDTYSAHRVPLSS